MKRIIIRTFIFIVFIGVVWFILSKQNTNKKPLPIAPTKTITGETTLKNTSITSITGDKHDESKVIVTSGTINEIQ